MNVEAARTSRGPTHHAKRPEARLDELAALVLHNLVFERLLCDGADPRHRNRDLERPAGTGRVSVLSRDGRTPNGRSDEGSK